MTETDQSCTTYTFAELSEEAKDKAREAYTDKDYLDYDWWDSVYEDFDRVCTILGIRISSHSVRLHGGETHHAPDIFFSGFGCQSDGASFKGSYRSKQDITTEIRNYCNDKELHRIADQLTSMQLTQRLLGLEFFSADIGPLNRGGLSIEIDNWGDETVGQPDQEQFRDLMMDLTAWLYAQLGAENDYLYSDECVDQYLVDETFDEDGAII